eukprot:GHVS01006981.1.p1 GENE.GHVS01006981.1~~GHVS01006981.1.p1  ORF type:complete len:168 (+),score=9.71 GHVS01006981.1:160-663(+)
MVLAQSLIPGLSVISITPLYDVPTDRSPNDAWPGVVAVAEVMKALPTLCNQAATVNHVLPVIIKMLRDPSPEIRVRVMECIPSLAGVVDIAYLTEVLLHFVRSLRSFVLSGVGSYVEGALRRRRRELEDSNCRCAAGSIFLRKTGCIFFPISHLVAAIHCLRSRWTS